MPDRERFISARIATLTNQERHLLEQALTAHDEQSARRFQRAADSAQRDAIAIEKEHDLDP